MTRRSPLALVTAGCWLAALFSATLTGCTDDAAPEAAGSRDPMLYLDYRISGGEGEESVTALLQFRRGSPDGRAVALEGGATVQLDTTRLLPDSAGFTGIFYEGSIPAASAAGTHRIVYRSPSGKGFTEDFRFTPFRLKGDDYPFAAGRDILLEVEGLLPEDRLQVAVTDTSFESEDINEELEVRNGQLLIPADLLRRVVPGPLSVQLTKEELRPLNEAPPAGGDIRITYSLNREWTMLPPR